MKRLHTHYANLKDLEAKMKHTVVIKAENPKTYTNTLGMEFVLIPSGSFIMGHDRVFDARPKHRVNITKSFYLGKYPVTNAQWFKAMYNSDDCGDQPNFPKTHVTWSAVQKFIKRLNDIEWVDNYRLPTEAEWEYACRAGSATKYFFGDDPKDLAKYAWIKENSNDSVHAVGKLRPNAWGLYDMLGNVNEWVYDYYKVDAYKNHTINDPVIELNSIKKYFCDLFGIETMRVNRGGCYYLSDSTDCCGRNWVSSTFNHADGFRVLKTTESYHRSMD